MTPADALPSDRCARCGHARRLHHPEPPYTAPDDTSCHYLGQHGGADHACGGVHSGYVGPRCQGFVEVAP